MLDLCKDQINSNAWAEKCDYIYSKLPDNHDQWESDLLSSNPHIKKINVFREIPKSGVIFINGHNSLLECLKSLKGRGSYILVARDRDASLTDSLIRHIPNSLKKLYSINSPYKNSVIEPIPVGCATRNGFSGGLVIVANEQIEKQYDKLIYCRLTLTKTQHGQERVDLININRNNPIFSIDHDSVNATEMYRKIKSHVFNACPAGEGKDCIRTYETIISGSIPIWSDCAETQHFSDLPVIYTNGWNNINKEWCDRKLEEFAKKTSSTDRMRMSYWVDHLENSKKQFL